MTRTSKLLAAVVAGNGVDVAFRDFEALLRAFGFTLARTKGSHRQYTHCAVPRPFPVQPDGKDAKRYQVRELLELIERYALTPVE